MKIELRRITYNARLSEETAAYAADVYVNGVKRGTTKNDGHGGGDMIHPHTLHAEIDAYAKTLPKKVYPWGEVDQSAEGIFAGLLETHLVARDLKRALKTKTVFTTGDGKLYTIKKLGVKPADAAKILNEMPFDEAVEVYMACTGGS